MKKSYFLFFLGVLLFTSVFSFAQNSTLNTELMPDSLLVDSLVVDTTKIEKQISTVDIQAINNLLHETETQLLKVGEMTSDARWIELDTIFSRKEHFIDQEAADFRAYDQPSLSKFFIENLRLAWSSYHSKTIKWQNELEKQLNQSVENTNKLLSRKVELEKYYIELKSENLTSLRNRIMVTIIEVDSAISKFNENKQRLLVLQTRVADKNILIEKVMEEIEQLDARLRGRTFTKTQPPIWNIHINKAFKGSIEESIGRAYRNNYKSVKYYLRNIINGIVQYLFLAALLVFMILFIRKKYMSLGYTSEVPGHVNIERVLLNNPIPIIVSLLITIWIGFFPFIPLILSDFLFFAILVTLGVILKPFIDKTGRKLLTTLTLLLLFNIFEVIIWYLGDYARIYLFFETAVSIIMIFPFLALYKKKTEIHKIRIVHLAKVFMPFVLSMYIIAFIGNVFGFVNLTVLFIKIGIRTAAITMIAYGYSRVLENVSYALLSLIDIKFPDIILKYGDVIKKRIKKAINIIIFYIWIDSILRVFELRTVFFNWLGEFLTNEATVGTFSISFSDVLLFSGILYVTYMLASFVKTIIEGEILRKMRLPRGIPAAISMIIRISLVTFGILFALSATGINLSSLGMIAGALGVGIGFGLQNIVQNFISGLILIFERPIQVGDTVEVDSLLGQVKDIGVRASNVITYDGAEVVVPNSNLISNNLINWTLSDSRKRVEIKVGTAYGTDPNIVLELIKKVAMDHPDVVRDPEPRALFEGFGDSSLDFRLLFWVNFEKGLGAKSDVAVGIYNIFAENNIEIPFPQVDLHVKDVAKNDVEETPKPKRVQKSKSANNEPLVDGDD